MTTTEARRQNLAEPSAPLAYIELSWATATGLGGRGGCGGRRRRRRRDYSPFYEVIPLSAAAAAASACERGETERGSLTSCRRVIGPAGRFSLGSHPKPLKI